MCLWCNVRSKAFQSLSAVQKHMSDKGHCKLMYEGNAMLEYSRFYDYSASYPDGQEPMEGGDDDDTMRRKWSWTAWTTPDSSWCCHLELG